MSGIDWLRNQPLYLDLRWSMSEGLLRAWRRRRIQRQILNTPPVRTARTGSVEVRALTWRRDCVDLIWALKSFYLFSRVDYPLYIHDGGLARGQGEFLSKHFPDATVVLANDAEREVTAELLRRGLNRCLEYRGLNVTTRKLFDFFLLSKADYIVSIDSDIVFFRRPELLCVPPEGHRENRYNKDEGYWYSMKLDELEASFGIRPIEYINSGLSVVLRQSIDFDAIERWLQHPKLFADRWVTEQTLHALCSAVNGEAMLLPESYKVSVKPGLTPDIVCKHYPGFFRPLHYEEGMSHLLETGFLDALRSARTSPPRTRSELPGA
ncbi:MAG: hypothetical protein ACLQDV_00545 [Candidatus Binataceae bacterium]